MESLNSDCIFTLLTSFKQDLPIFSQVNKYFNELINDNLWKQIFYSHLKLDNCVWDYRYLMMIYWESAESWAYAAFLEVFISECMLNPDYNTSESVIIPTHRFLDNCIADMFEAGIDAWSIQSALIKVRDFKFTKRYTNNFLQHYINYFDELYLNGMLLGQGLVINYITDLEIYLEKMTSLTVHDQDLGISTIKFVHDEIECDSVFIDPDLDLGYLMDNYKLMTNLESLAITSGYSKDNDYNHLTSLPPNIKDLYIDNLNIDLSLLKGVINLKINNLTNNCVDKVYLLPSSIKKLIIYNSDHLIDLSRVRFEVIIL
jgi:hypothetical protein